MEAKKSSLWLTIRTPPRKLRSARLRASTVSKSRKFVGSSRQTTWGFVQKAAPMISLDFWPPEKTPMLRCADISSDSPKFSKCLTISRRVSGRSSLPVCTDAKRSSSAVAMRSTPSCLSFATDSNVFCFSLSPSHCTS
mmetsp:Transcript_52501/g.98438  ORF Transcript_52501/g.98438 Transcript_52501/m.98438 type:complete len:138 (-) Transcript_52501:90-503(-)